MVKIQTFALKGTYSSLNEQSVQTVNVMMPKLSDVRGLVRAHSDAL